MSFCDFIKNKKVLSFSIENKIISVMLMYSCEEKKFLIELKFVSESVYHLFSSILKLSIISAGIRQR